MIYYKRRSWLKKILFKFSGIKFSYIPFLIFLKSMTICFLCLIFLIYASYLFLLPKYVKEENIENILNTYLSKNTKLTLDINNLKIYPNYKLNINLKADNIKLNYPNKTNFITLNNTDIEINLINLFFKYIDLNKIKTDKIIISTNFTKNNRYNCFDYFNLDVLDLKSNNSNFQIRNVKILANELIFNLYDENISKKFNLNSKNLILKLSDINKPLNISTFGFIKSDKKLLDYNLNLEYTFNQNAVKKFKTFIEKLDYNPLIEADRFKFYTKSDINLKIIPKNSKNDITGYIKLTDLTFIIDNLQIPKNNIIFNFKGDKINALIDFNLIKNQFIKIKLNVIHSKNKLIELNINSNEINLFELKRIINAIYKILNLKYNLDNVDISGNLSADLYLKSDFKTILSKGSAKIQNAQIKDKKTGLILQNINSNINLENNKINIINANALIDKSKFYLNGTIDDKTNLNLKMNSDTINIAQILSLVKTLPIINHLLPRLDDYEFKTGFLNINAQITGNLNSPLINSNSYLKELKMYVKSMYCEIFIKEIKITANPKNNDIGDIDLILSDLLINYQKNKIKIPKLILKIINKDILINKSIVFIQNLDNLKVEIEGNIKDYNIQPIINLNINCLIPAKNNFLIIKNHIPKFNANILINKNKLNLLSAKIFDNNKNLILLSGSINNFNSKNLIVENLKINILEKISLTLPSLNSINLDVIGNITLNGNINKPLINGNLNLYNIICKDINLFIKDAILNIKDSSCYINIIKGHIFDFDFDLVAQGILNLDKIDIKFLRFSSTYVDLSKIQKYIQNNHIQNKFKINISDLKGDILTLNILDINLNSFYFEGKLENNILKLNKFNADIYEGKIQGNTNINLNNLKINSDIILKEIPIRYLSSQLKEYSIAASGKLSALIQAEFTGLDYENIIKTLKGYIKFNINDGELNQFAKLERFLQAGNILSQSILKLTLNSTISALTKQNTGDFKTIEGTVKINNALAEIQYIKTQGTNMSLYITGRFNLLNQIVNLKVLGRIPSSIVNVMGNVGKFSTGQLVEKMSQDAQNIIKSITVSPIEKMMSTYISDEEINNIPQLSNQQEQTITREFIVLISGAIDNKSSIKYFKWRER